MRNYKGHYVTFMKNKKHTNGYVKNKKIKLMKLIKTCEHKLFKTTLKRNINKYNNKEKKVLKKLIQLFNKDKKIKLKFVT